MSRAGTTFLQEKEENVLYKLPPLSGTKWTEQISSVTTLGEVQIPNTYDMVNLEAYDILDSQARAMVVSLHRVVRRLTQATVTSIRLIHSIPFAEQKPQEQDIWIDMPPLSVRNVVFDVERMGWGEPLPFPEEFAEE